MCRPQPVANARPVCTVPLLWGVSLYHHDQRRGCWAACMPSLCTLHGLPTCESCSRPAEAPAAALRLARAALCVNPVRPPPRHATVSGGTQGGWQSGGRRVWRERHDLLHLNILLLDPGAQVARFLLLLLVVRVCHGAAADALGSAGPRQGPVPGGGR